MKHEPTADWRAAAGVSKNLFDSLVFAGFTEPQALKLTADFMIGMALGPPINKEDTL